MKLFWVTTEDHAEDWFIVAQSAEAAHKEFEDHEGYNPGSATAEYIMDIPSDCPAAEGWPSNGLLLSLGAVFKSLNAARVVELNGKTFCEGLLQSIIEQPGQQTFTV